METESETQVVTPTPVVENGAAPETAITTTGLMQIAMSSDMDVEKLRALMDLKDRDDAKQAKLAFIRARTEFKANAPKIVKDKTNSQFNSKYTSIEALVNPAAEELSKHGLSHHWEFPEREDGSLAVRCVLTHDMGHSESVTRCGPPDSSGAKNDLQKIKSTTTYLEIVTFQAVTGLASEDAHLDDDGNAAGKNGNGFITEEQVLALDRRIADVDADLGKFLKFFKIETLSALPSSAYAKADKMLAAKEAQCGV